VAKTHRVLVVEEQKPFCGVGAQLAYMIQHEAFDELDAPIARLCTVDAPAIYSPPVEIEQLPTRAASSPPPRGAPLTAAHFSSVIACRLLMNCPTTSATDRLQ